MTTSLKDLYTTAVQQFEDREYAQAGLTLEKVRSKDIFANTTPDFQSLVNFLLARIKRTQGLVEEAFNLVQEVMNKPLSPPQQAEGYDVLASLAFSNGELGVATNFVTQELEVARQIPDDRRVAKCHYYRGEILRFLGKHQEALTDFLQGHKLLEGMDSPSDARQLTRVLNGMALTYRALDQPKKALNYLEEALQVDTQLGEHDNAVVDYYNLFLVALEMGMLDKARTYRDILQADGILEESLLHAPILNLLEGFLQLQQGDYLGAQASFDRGVEKLGEFPFFEIIVSARLGTIKALLLANKTTDPTPNAFEKFKESLVHEFNQTLELTGQNRYWPLAIDLLLILAQTYYVLQNPEMAEKTTRQTKTLVDDWQLQDQLKMVEQVEQVLPTLAQQEGEGEVDYRARLTDAILMELATIQKRRNL